MKREVRGLANIKTAQRCKIHAKPKLSGTEHLDLFLLQKNRNRLQQEMQYVQERQERLKKDIQGIDEEMAKITRSVNAAAAPHQNMPEERSEAMARQACFSAEAGARNRELPPSMKKIELRY